MGQPAAKQGDQVIATDTHIVMIPSPGGPVPTPLPHPFVGHPRRLARRATSTSRARPAAVQGSTATNTPSHIPQGGPFQKPPANKATIMLGSATVLINGKPAARNGDTAMTCNDPADLPIGQVVAVGTVLIGG